MGYLDLHVDEHGSTRIDSSSEVGVPYTSLFMMTNTDLRESTAAIIQEYQSTQEVYVIKEERKPSIMCRHGFILWSYVQRILRFETWISLRHFEV